MSNKKKPTKKARTQYVGIEYELEGLAAHAEDWYDEVGQLPQDWRIEVDGTLRGQAGEFVSNKLPIEGAVKSSMALIESLDGQYEVSQRCSMHIHIGLAGMLQWQKVALYAMLVAEEEFFFQYDMVRKRNHFCTPVLYTPSFYQGLAIISDAPERGDKNELLAHSPLLPMERPYRVECKYSCVNASPSGMHEIGTVELRHFTPLMREADLQVIMDKIAEIAKRAHACPVGTSAAMYEYLTALMPTFTNPSALGWVIAAIQQMEEDVLPDRVELSSEEAATFAAIDRARTRGAVMLGDIALNSPPVSTTASPSLYRSDEWTTADTPWAPLPNAGE